MDNKNLYDENQQIDKRKEKVLNVKLNVIDLKNASYLDIYKFLENPKINIIDIKDLYSSKYLVRLIKEKGLFNSEIDIFNYTLNNKFLETNDIKCLESFNSISLSGKSSKRNSINTIEIDPKTKNIDFNKLVTFLRNNPSPVKHTIFQFCDILTLARIGLVNKYFYDFIYKYCDFRKNLQQLCEILFKPHLNYNIVLTEIYKNSHSKMLSYAPRVFFSGLYIEKLHNIIGVKEKKSK